MVIQRALAADPEFLRLLGMFHGAFASLDLITDFAIGKFLNLPSRQTHLVTAGMMFGPKARLLADLIGRSDHQNKAAILTPFNRLRGNHKREIIAHGYLWSDQTSVKFTQRIHSGEFVAKEHVFTLPTFREHVLTFVNDSGEFYVALDARQVEVNEFADAAMSLNRKSKTSPGNPASSAS